MSNSEEDYKQKEKRDIRNGDAVSSSHETAPNTDSAKSRVR